MKHLRRTLSDRDRLLQCKINIDTSLDLAHVGSSHARGSEIRTSTAHSEAGEYGGCCESCKAEEEKGAGGLRFGAALRLVDGAVHDTVGSEVVLCVDNC